MCELVQATRDVMSVIGLYAWLLLTLSALLSANGQGKYDCTHALLKLSGSISVYI